MNGENKESKFGCVFESSNERSLCILFNDAFFSTGDDHDVF